MSGPAEAAFGDEDRARLARVADVILPRTPAMPAASEVGVQGALLDRVLAAMPDLAPRLRDALGRVGAEPAAALAELRGRAPDLFKAVMLAVCAAYYLSPAVRERLAYPGQEARTIDVHELPSYLEDGSLERVVARGPLYQDPDG